MVKSAKESINQKASNSEIYGKMQAVFIEMDNCPDVSIYSLNPLAPVQLSELIHSLLFFWS